MKHSTFQDRSFLSSYEYGIITLKESKVLNNFCTSYRKSEESNKTVVNKQPPANADAKQDGFWCRKTKFFGRKICHRVSSAQGKHSEHVCDRQVNCGEKIFSRHFCELFSPNLCKDCSRRNEQTQARSIYRVSEDANPITDNDPFTMFVKWNANCTDGDQSTESDSDLLSNDLSDNEDSSFTKYSPTFDNKESPDMFSIPCRDTDSGFESRSSTRLSHIRTLARSDSVSTRFKGLNRENTAFSRKNQEGKTKSSPISPGLKDNYTGKLSNAVSKSNLPERRPEVNKHLIACHGKSLAALYSYGYPEKNKNDWIKKPVQPVLMDLKFINFTAYEKPFHVLAAGVGLRDVNI